MSAEADIIAAPPPLRDEEGKRNLHIVVECLLNLVSSHNDELKMEIEKFRDSLWNIAPEATGRRHHWIDLARRLGKHTPVNEDDLLDWHKRVIDLFNDKLKLEDVFVDSVN
jgi:hypothetical protein